MLVAISSTFDDMGGKITIGLAIVATTIFYGTDSALFWATLATTVMTFWSVGIMHNFAMDSAKARRKRIIDNKIYEQADDKEINRIKDLPINIEYADLRSVPNWLTWLNLIFSIGIYVLLTIGIYKRFL